MVNGDVLIEKTNFDSYAKSLGDSSIDYSTYKMSFSEKVLYFLIAFAVGAFVGYLFYGGIGKDIDGNPTTLTYVLNTIIPLITGIIAGKLFLPVRVKQIIEKRKKTLRLEFRDMLEALATSLNAGKNVPDSFKSTYDDLKVQYPEDAFILKEIERILIGIDNNINIEDVLYDFGKRSGVVDIENFANVFKTSYSRGANIKEVIKNTHSIIGDKISIEMDIETIVAANKMEQYIMTVMPIGLVAMIKMIGPEFAENFTTPVGIISSTIAIVVFVVSYFISKEILTIN
jgi:tight adherence protein B